MVRRTLVTGGAGFIGSHVVDRLTAMGEEVVVFDDLSSGHTKNLSSCTDFVEADIRNQKALGQAMEGCDSVIHLAAKVSVQDCINDWNCGTSINLLGSVMVFQTAWRKGNLPVIYASSAAIYGNRDGEICTEGDIPLPISPYGADKLGMEHHARAMSIIHRLPSVGLRFFNVYGPRQDFRSPYAGVISKFCENRKSNRNHIVFGDGKQSRDFIYIDDIVDGLIMARDYADKNNNAANVFNLCSGHAVDLLTLIDKIDTAASASSSAKIEYMQPREGDIQRSLGSPQLCYEELGFSVQTSLVDGLEKLWLSLQENNR